MVRLPAYSYSRFLTILRVILYLVLTCLCLYFSTYTLAKYMAGETIILSSGDEEETVLFPSITFCRKFIFDEVWKYFLTLHVHIISYIPLKLDFVNKHIVLNQCYNVYTVPSPSRMALTFLYLSIVYMFLLNHTVSLSCFRVPVLLFNLCTYLYKSPIFCWNNKYLFFYFVIFWFSFRMCSFMFHEILSSLVSFFLVSSSAGQATMLQHEMLGPETHKFMNRDNVATRCDINFFLLLKSSLLCTLLIVFYTY